MKRLDPFFHKSNRFVIMGKGNERFGEVFLLNERHIVLNKKARRGLRCVRVVGY